MRYAVQWIVWFVLMALVMGWLARSRSRSRAASDAALLYHPTSTLIAGYAGCNEKFVLLTTGITGVLSFEL